MDTFDATDDYVTCERCGRIRDVDASICPTCRVIDSLTAERFTGSSGPDRLRELGEVVRRKRARRANGRL